MTDNIVLKVLDVLQVPLIIHKSDLLTCYAAVRAPRFYRRNEKFSLQIYRLEMSTSADVQSMEKEVVVNGKPHIDEESSAIIESEYEPQCSVIENSPPEPTETESLSDWFVMICVLLCNMLNGIHFASYGVLYLPLTDMFQSSRAAVGWIMSFDFALASFLGEVH